MKKIKKRILGLFLVIFAIGIFPNITFNPFSSNHDKIFNQNKVFAEESNLVGSKVMPTQSSIKQETVTINFLNVDNPAVKVQKSEMMTVNVGDYVWVGLETMPMSSTKSLYHIYHIPKISNYSYQYDDIVSPLLVTENSATNVINLYYKRDTSQVTINFLNSDNVPIQPSETITANVGDYIWIVSLGVNSEQERFGVYWYLAPEIDGYSFKSGTPIKVSKNSGTNIVNLYYAVHDIEYSFEYEYAKDTPDTTSALPPSFTAKKEEITWPVLPEGYYISDVRDENDKSYLSPIEAVNAASGNHPKNFRIIVSAKKSELEWRVTKPNDEEVIKRFSELYGKSYKLPVEATLTSNGKIYNAVIKIVKIDWKNGVSVRLIDDPDEVSSLLKGNLLVGKYDSATTSISVSYKEKVAVIPIPPANGKGGNESPQVPSKDSEEMISEKKEIPQVTVNQTKEKVEEKPKQSTTVRVNDLPEKLLKAPLAPPRPSFPATQGVIANRSITDNINQKAHILKLRIAGAAGLAAGTASAYGILRALKMMLQHFGKLSNLIK